MYAFKLGGSAVFVVLCSILIIKFVESDHSSSKHSICERKRSTPPYVIEKFRCPEERIWFGPSFLSIPSSDKRQYCCGTIENRFCCKKSELKRELYIRQRSDSQSEMSSIGGIIFTIAFFAIFCCICCKCLSACFGKKRLNGGLIIQSTANPHPGTVISGQNVHVINPPVSQPQYPYPPANQYPPAQYPPVSQYQPTGYPSAQYPPTSYPSAQYPDYNQPPPAYTPAQAPIYPPPFKSENNQTSANERNQAPSAPDF